MKSPLGSKYLSCTLKLPECIKILKIMTNPEVNEGVMTSLKLLCSTMIKGSASIIESKLEKWLYSFILMTAN